MNLPAWLRDIWPNKNKRWKVIGEYAALKDTLVLTDIVLRGGVFSTFQRAPGDPFGDGINEGRRQLALEIMKLAGADPGQLYELTERRSSQAAGANQ